MNKHFFKLKTGSGSAVILFLLIIFIFPSEIKSMESANYKIDKDSVNFGGNDSGQSSNYGLDDTMGEAGTGDSKSSNFIIDAGYRSMLETKVPTFSFLLSSNTCALGNLTVGAVSSCNYTVTISTNSQDGYATTIIEDGNLRDGANEINDVADGAVTAGSEEYGIGLTGADRAFANDQAITGAALTIASDATGPISVQQVTITHKASITSSTLAGSYSHTATIVSTGTF